jgi:hypothetical protein
MRALADIIGLRTGECRDCVDAIAQIAAGEKDIDQSAAGHVARCLRCQAEVVAYRRILHTMRAMRQDRIPPPNGGVASVLAALEAASTDHAGGSTTWATRAAYLGGITVATAAAGAGVLVWMNRRRLGLAATG